MLGLLLICLNGLRQHRHLLCSSAVVDTSQAPSQLPTCTSLQHTAVCYAAVPAQQVCITSHLDVPV